MNGTRAGLLLFIVFAATTGASSELAADSSIPVESYSAEDYGIPYPNPGFEIGASGVVVKYQKGTRSYEWRVPNLWPDTYQDPRVIHDQSGDFLLVFVGSRGNHCCVEVLQFDLRSGKYVGEALVSMGDLPLEIRPDEAHCAIVIRATEPDVKIETNPKYKNLMEAEGALPTKDFCFLNGQFKAIRTIR